ncbi:MAG: hypothetical protein NZ951_05360 [Dehalococcoidia bacterium]|nr:hypothetical protein [Dehalococcoidia bacterium]MDW8120199.1 hypothetical protein [Chloroflexota bacterium]
MSLSVHTLFLRSGRKEERSPYGVVFPGRGAWKGMSFFGVCEATAGAQEALCAWALEEIQRHLARSRSSLTKGLEQAVQACHLSLAQAQEAHPPNAQTGLGIVVGALRGDEVTLAWAGPGLVCLKEGQTLHLLPQTAASPIGQGKTPLAVSLRRFTFPPAQALLVCQSHLRRLTTLQGLEVVLSATPQQSLDRLHALLRDDPAFAAVLVSGP